MILRRKILAVPLVDSLPPPDVSPLKYPSSGRRRSAKLCANKHLVPKLHQPSSFVFVHRRTFCKYLCSRQMFSGLSFREGGILQSWILNQNGYGLFIGNVLWIAMSRVITFENSDEKTRKGSSLLKIPTRKRARGRVFFVGIESQTRFFA